MKNLIKNILISGAISFGSSSCDLKSNNPYSEDLAIMRDSLRTTRNEWEGVAKEIGPWDDLFNHYRKKGDFGKEYQEARFKKDSLMRETYYKRQEYLAVIKRTKSIKKKYREWVKRD